MGSFAEMAGEFRRGPQDQIRRLVNQTALPISEGVDRMRERRTSEGWFKSAKLYDFLTEACDFAKEDGHPEATLEFELSEADTDVDPTPLATATLKWNIIHDEAADGYTFARLEYKPLRVMVKVVGSEEEFFLALPDEKNREGIKKAFVRAYHNPGVRNPMHHAGDAKVEDKTDSPKPFRFLNETGDYSSS